MLIIEADRARCERNIKRQADGGAFNVFEILNVERKEVGTHSNMLANILNPKSEHTMGEKFLELFIKHIGFSTFSDNSWEIEREKSTPYGRIDFWITSKKHHLCLAVEMKIDGADQEKQLCRYETYVKSVLRDKCSGKPYFNDYRVLYLTLDGHPPSKQSINTMDESKLICISFKREILNWLEECILLTPSKKKVFSAMVQYKSLVEKLVGESESIELVKILHNKENYMALKELQSAEKTLKKEFMAEFWDSLIKALPEGFEYAKNMCATQDFYRKSGIVCLHYKTNKTFTANNIIYHYYVFISAGSGKNECLWTGIYLYNAEKDKCPKVKSRAIHLLEELGLNEDSFEDGYSDDYFQCCLGSSFIYSKDGNYYQFNDFSQPVINMLDNILDDINHISSQVRDLLNAIEKDN